MNNKTRFSICALAVGFALAGAARAEGVKFMDPTGDDKGPGAYVYPTDKVYKPGSFDLTELKVKTSGEKVEFAVSVGSALEDPWGMGVGFATQMVFVFIDTDHKEGSGFTKGLPGLNVAFAPADAWDRCVILSPQPQNRVTSEVETKAAWANGAVLVPTRTRGAGRTISGTVSLKELGEGDPATWGYAAAVMSQEGFPSTGVWRIRDVTAEGGQWKIGGGSGAMNETRILDLIWPEGAAPTQEEMLSGFSPSSTAVGELTADDFAQLPLITVQ